MPINRADIETRATANALQDWLEWRAKGVTAAIIDNDHMKIFWSVCFAVNLLAREGTIAGQFLSHS